MAPAQTRPAAWRARGALVALSTRIQPKSRDESIDSPVYANQRSLNQTRAPSLFAIHASAESYPRAYELRVTLDDDLFHPLVVRDVGDGADNVMRCAVAAHQGASPIVQPVHRTVGQKTRNSSSRSTPSVTILVYTAMTWSRSSGCITSKNCSSVTLSAPPKTRSRPSDQSRALRRTSNRKVPIFDASSAVRAFLCAVAGLLRGDLFRDVFCGRDEKLHRARAPHRRDRDARPDDNIAGTDEALVELILRDSFAASFAVNSRQRGKSSGRSAPGMFGRRHRRDRSRESRTGDRWFTGSGPEDRTGPDGSARNRSSREGRQRYRGRRNPG